MNESKTVATLIKKAEMEGRHDFALAAKKLTQITKILDGCRGEIILYALFTCAQLVIEETAPREKSLNALADDMAEVCVRIIRSLDKN